MARTDAGGFVLATLAGGVPGLFFSPGHMSADSLTQIAQIRSGQLTDWHAPVFQMLWIPFDRIGLGPGALTILIGMLVGSSIYLLLRGHCRPAVATPLAVAVTISPQLFGYLGVVSRDTWFLATMLGALAWTAVATRSRGRARWLAGAMAVALLWVMGTTRQNAPPLIAVVGFCLAGMALDRARGGARRPLARLAAQAGLAAVLMVAFATSYIAVRRAAGVADSNVDQAVAVYDLTILSRRERTILLPEGSRVTSDLSRFATERPWYDVNPMLWGPAATGAIVPDGPAADELRTAWIDAIVDDPVAYFREKWRIWTRQIGWSGNTIWVVHPVIDPNDMGFSTRFPTLDRWGMSYATLTANDRLEGGVIHRAWLYLLFHALPFAIRPLARLRLAATTSVAYAATMFIGGLGVQYRWVLPHVAVGLIISAAAIVELVRWLRDRPHPPVMGAAHERSSLRDTDLVAAAEPTGGAAVPAG